MFTDADHAKAVELYKRFGTAEWWPKCVQRRFHDGLDAEHWHDGSEYDGWAHPQHALSAIAWAMVDKLKVNVMLGPGASIYDSSGTFIVRTNWHVSVGLTTYARDTPFLALAAAIEDQK